VRVRPDKAKLTIGLTSLIWLAALVIGGIADSLLPWCAVLFVTSLIFLCNAKKQPQGQISQSLIGENKTPNGEHRTPIGKHKIGIFGQIRENKAVTFLASCATSYALLSMMLGCWIVMHLLVKHTESQIKVEQQVVDIELVALKDYQDKQMLLSGSKPKPTLRKSVPSPQVTVHGVSQIKLAKSESLNPAKSRGDDSSSAIDPRASQMPMPAHVAAKASSAKSPVLATAGVNAPTYQTKFFLVQGQPLAESASRENDPTRLVTKPVPPSVMQASRQKNTTKNLKTPAQKKDEPFMEELRPPEMIELVDNKGDQSPNVWQPGGHSQDSTGQHSDLVDYLKELNKKIKSAWIPPGKDSRAAEVLFRIRDTGRLAFVRILHSSGNNELDSSVVKAIAGTAPFRPLPSGYPLGYLDVRYTFNYKVDGLAEIRNSAWQ
jgi:TonB family protein